MPGCSPERRKRSKWDDERGVTDGDRDLCDHERVSIGRSRWDDRRSRSPRARGRSRSPFSIRQSSDTPTSESKKTVDPAAAAAAAAARINASIQAKRGVQHVDVPPIRSASGEAKSASPPTTLNTDVYIADGDYIKDIEVNDLRNRYTLTKGATQKMIKEETGADVTTRGAYYPDKSMATTANPPLYLHVTSTTKEGLEKAVARIEELMKQELPNLVDERRFRRREPPEPVERDEFGRRKWPEEKVTVGLEPIPGFNLRASVVGHGGQYVKHIQQETRCRVQIKGRGSGFKENGLDESDEPLYLHVTGPDPREVQRGKELCEDLLASVRRQYEEHRMQPQPARFPGYGAQNNFNGIPAQSTSVSLSGSATPGTQPPPPPSSASPPGTETQGNASSYANPYAAYYSGTDPYAAYGGYPAYVQYYQSYYSQQQGTTAPGTSNSSPPPGGYNSVPPPPGL